MADKDSADGPSLEMPTLGSMFRRKKKGKGSADDAQTPTAEDFDALVRGDRFEPKPDPVADADEATADDDAATVPAPPADDPAQSPADATTNAPVDAPVDASVDGPREAEEVAAPVVDDETVPEPEAPEPDDEPTVVVPTVAEPEAAAEEEREPRPKREFSLPPLAARTAAAVTGLAIGILAVGLTLGSLRGCEAIKGTSSCGTPGFFLLVAIMIILVAVGSALLGAWKVTEPSSTSFLAVGLLAVIALLFLVRVIFSPWMIIVIPIVAVVTYTASQWLTSLFEDDEEVVPE